MTLKKKRSPLMHLLAQMHQGRSFRKQSIDSITETEVKINDLEADHDHFDVCRLAERRWLIGQAVRRVHFWPVRRRRKPPSGCPTARLPRC